MPIYEYECEKCGAVFEKLVKNSAQKIVCEKCGARKVKKLFSTFAPVGDSSKDSSQSCPACNLNSSCSTCSTSGGCTLN